MGYSDIVEQLVSERTSRGWSRVALAEKLGVSNQVLTNWENQRNRASYEDLQHWAGFFSRRVVLVAPREAEQVLPEEVQFYLTHLKPTDQQWVVRFASVIGRLDTRDQGILTDVVEAMERSLARDEASSKPA